MFHKYKDLQIYYQTAGSGKDLILLHGWKQDVSTWWGIVDLLKDDFKIWMIDLPGFGRSNIPGKPWNISDYVDSVGEFIKENKINKPILLGHSLGGNVAIKLASSHPEIVSKLILEDSSGFRKKSTLRSQIFLFGAKLLKYLIPDSTFKERLRNKLYGSIGSDYLSAGPLRKTFQNIVSEDLTGEAKNITTETLIIWGEKDREVPVSSANKLYHLIENSSLEIMEGVGHFPHLENTKLFTYYVKDFSGS